MYTHTLCYRRLKTEVGSGKSMGKEKVRSDFMDEKKLLILPNIHVKIYILCN